MFQQEFKEDFDEWLNGEDLSNLSLSLSPSMPPFTRMKTPRPRILFPPYTPPTEKPTIITTSTSTLQHVLEHAAEGLSI
jgi:hypothetical protein